MKNKITIVIAALALVCCTKNAEVSQESAQSQDGVFATAQDFTGTTKTAVDESGKFSWVENDVIGVVPADNQTVQSNYTIKNILESDPRHASFDGGAWALKEGKEYIAYYPYQSVVLTSNGNAELTFSGQTQDGNNNRDHIGSYDYMWAKKVAPSEGSATFLFTHKISLVKITLPVPETATYTKLTFSCTDAVFAESATMAIADGSLTLGVKKRSISLMLNDISLSKGDNLVAWLSVCPNVVGEDKVFSATLTTSAGKNLSVDFSKKLSEFIAGKAYGFEASYDSVIFDDDFGWVSPVIEATGANPCADFVNGEYASLSKRLDDGNENSRGLYASTSPWKDEVASKLKDYNYADDSPSNKVIYAQGTSVNPYLKFCKGNTQTALIVIPFTRSYSEVELSLDWAIHMTTTALDVVHLQFKIEGGGTIVGGSGNKSAAIASGMTEVADPFWSNVRIRIQNVTKDTKIYISSKEAFDASYAASGQHRFYIDNLHIEAK